MIVKKLTISSLSARQSHLQNERTIKTNWQRAGRPSAFALPAHRRASSGLVVIILYSRVFFGKLLVKGAAARMHIQPISSVPT